MSRFNRQFFILMLPSYIFGNIIGHFQPMSWGKVFMVGIIFGLVINGAATLYNHLEKKDGARDVD